ncbi:leucine-rich repeat domain-containing protein (plasmid) [Clostridium baratii]
MKKQRMILLASILTISLNIFATKVFAQDKDITPEMRNKDSIKITYSENNSKQDSVEDKEIHSNSDIINNSSNLNINSVDSSQKVEIPDPALKKALNNNLGHAESSDLTISDLRSFKGTLNLSNLGISNLTGLEHCINVTELLLNGNKIEDLSPLKPLKGLKFLNLKSNRISDIKPLKWMNRLEFLDLDGNCISDLSPLDSFDSKYVLNWLSLKDQKIKLEKVIIDDGFAEINNPIIFPKTGAKKNISIKYNNDYGKISYDKNSKKIVLNNINDSFNPLIINESFIIENLINGASGSFNIGFSAEITVPVEHVSSIKVDLPTSMTFDIVTNTVDPATNKLKATFATSDYTINNKGRKRVNIIPSYSVTSQGGINLVKSINNSDISKDNNIKIAINLRNISTNKTIMSVVDNSIGDLFYIEPGENAKLRFEPIKNGMADAEKEQLIDTKTTLGKIIFTLSN